MDNNLLLNKYRISVSLLFLSLSTYGQLTISEMMSVYKMNLDQLETFSLKKGYTFHRIETDENKNITAVSYRKGTGFDTKYLRMYTVISKSGLTVDTQTSDEKDILRLKNSIEEQGFKLTSAREFEGTYYKEYSKDKWLLQMFTKSGDYEISMSRN